MLQTTFVCLVGNGLSDFSNPPQKYCFFLVYANFLTKKMRFVLESRTFAILGLILLLSERCSGFGCETCVIENKLDIRL